MTLGDGIRRNIATVSKEERDLFIDAIKQLNQIYYSPTGSRTDFPAGHVSYWFKQDEIHQSSHVHGCPAFLPWHRELCNRFEALLRMIHPELSLHYWDWNFAPSNMRDADGNVVNLFDSNFMGNADRTVKEGSVREPLLSAGFYLLNPSDPDPANGQFRDNQSPVILNKPNPNDPTTWSYPTTITIGGNTVLIHYNPADPPKTLTRNKQPGAPPIGVAGSRWPKDSDLINAATWENFRDLMYGDEQGTSATGAHGAAHSYIGGNLSNAHLSFRDPFVFLLHANIDRLWAMWQRQPGKSDRLDPDKVYNTESNTTGSGDVDSGDPFWGILSPLEPWAGFNAQTLATGIVTSLMPIRPWYPPENEQTLPGNYKTSKDISIVIPPSYDTAPHSSYVIANQDTFSSSQEAVSPTFQKAFFVVYDGFQPREVGTPTTSNPAITFMIGTTPVTSITAVNPQVFLEDPNGAPDMPQRISIAYDIVFLDNSAFPTTSGAETAVTMNIALNYTVGGTSVSTVDKTSVNLILVNQPSPYMVDIDPKIPPPGPPNPYWLSTDTRVFKIKQNDSIAGITQQSDPFSFIKSLVGAFNALPDDNNHPFLTQLTQDENASQLELSPTFNGTPVFNYAIAKIRYKGNVPASNVSAFFRLFKTMVSSLDYDHTSGPTGNYRRSGNTTGSAPLLGIQSNEIASIPFFAKARISTQTQSMTTQTDDPINTQINFLGNGQDEVIYCGVWLDINDINNPRFPQDPTSDPGGVDGPYQNQLFTIQQLVTGLHYCMVTEIFFWPPGTTTDPIPINSTPASSDRLAQRNLSLDSSGNPGWPSTHTVQHTFLTKPSIISIDKSFNRENPREISIGPDELIIQWGNVPRGTKATLFFPEVKADEILSLSALRQHPAVLAKADDHTISIRIADMTFIPLPARPSGNIAGLITLTLPQGIRVGQVFKMNVQQYSGISLPRRAHRMLGAFQFNIPVNADPEILPNAIRNLSILRYIHQTIPTTNRWHTIFVRWLNSLAAKVVGLGGDPTHVLPSPTGGDTSPADHHYKPEPWEISSRDLWSMNIPWKECDIDGEVDIKFRFRKKSK
ncbi:MAG: tyrosinase family protein [Nitrosotalea sp.]